MLQFMSIQNNDVNRFSMMSHFPKGNNFFFKVSKNRPNFFIFWSTNVVTMVEAVK